MLNNLLSNATVFLVCLSAIKTMNMKLMAFSALLLMATGLANCSKQSNKPSGITGNKLIAVRDCTSFIHNSSSYSLCLDSVSTDSRCATGAQCIWEGNAKVKFTLSVGTAQHHFALNTAAYSSGNKLQHDTVIDRLKIQLVNLTPHPDINVPLNYNDYKAEVAITEH